MEAAEDEFADLYQREACGVLSYFRAHASDWQEAEDLAAETFLRAWVAWPRFAKRGIPERHWLLRIARNLVIDAARRRAARPTVTRNESAAPDSTSGVALARASLESALSELTEEARELIGLRATGLSFGEIGELSGRTGDAAKMAWHRAAQKLKAAMEASDD
jgi:RNA polymerase sigma-70 factor (ECF subfamily)